MTSASYQSFAEIGDDTSHVMIHVLPSDGLGGHSWQHYIHDLDDFFNKIYKYHQKSGFVCIVLSNILELIQILFVIFFTIFLFHFIDYDILFKKKIINVSPKVTISDVLIPYSRVTFNVFEVYLIVIAIFFWFFKLFKTIHTIVVNHAIKAFYNEALHITDVTLFTWQDIQNRLIQAQHVCLLQDGQLNELVIHNRLLRHHNFMIALINKGLLPIHYKVPFIGEVIYLTKGLQFNFQLLLFKTSFSLFENNWKLKDEVKTASNRVICAQRFAKYCLILALINFILFPLISLWQLLYIIYTYAEAIKRDPSMALGSRSWSLYAKWYCRHFNELDHQLSNRLNSGYKAATKYMNSFTSPTLEVLARFFLFIAGTMLSVIIILTVFDEDVVTVEHIITLATFLGAVIAISRTFVSSEIPSRYTQAELNAKVLEHIHYKPHGYAPYTSQARNAMSCVFQYRIISVLEQLISPLATPYILMRHLRPRALEIVDFFHNYTVDITGTGDVCTFAMMNIRENGNPLWKPNISCEQKGVGLKIDENMTDISPLSPRATENGKLELSLIHFKLTNPNWRPINDSQKKFIDNIKSNCGPNESQIMTRSGLNSSLRINTTSDATPPPSNSSSSNNEPDIESNAYRNERERLLNAMSNSLTEQEERAAAMSLSTLFLHQYASNSITRSQPQESSESHPLLHPVSND
ncbi:autophagy-related protein 9A-like [Oppia nitens]|uniref:autophagy-related protein 9A-like n=1 Tax=Oppia nitens TaxID=1686743 RepID=UPI0023DB9FC1|nr:autophagy-related protein 9A-like [Oppia nitens]XP_054163523.1 autophagy-related protein 9A-like [Oppia nitens]